jgi:hypothetical protein
MAQQTAQRREMTHRGAPKAGQQARSNLQEIGRGRDGSLGVLRSLKLGYGVVNVERGCRPFGRLVLTLASISVGGGAGQTVPSEALCANQTLNSRPWRRIFGGMGRPGSFSLRDGSEAYRRQVAPAGRRVLGGRSAPAS